jgi:hypothetical protein
MSRFCVKQRSSWTSAVPVMITPAPAADAAAGAAEKGLPRQNNFLLYDKDPDFEKSGSSFFTTLYDML